MRLHLPGLRALLAITFVGAFAGVPLAQTAGPAGPPLEQALAEMRADVQGRAERGIYPIMGMKPDDAREALGRIHSLDRDEWAAAWSAQGDRYLAQWRDFSEDSLTIRSSCYGRRVFGTQDGSPSQWELLKQILRYDPMSRRAVLNFQQEPSEALRPDSLDTPCATVLQFFLRNKRVHAVAYMRSNDAVWGLPYDVFLFTMLQEMLACEMGLDLGNYSHIAGSSHVCARHFDLIRRIVAGVDPPAFSMPPMMDLAGAEDFLSGERAGDPNRTSFGSLRDRSEFLARSPRRSPIFLPAPWWHSIPDRLTFSPYQPVLAPFLGSAPGSVARRRQGLTSEPAFQTR